MGKGFIYSEGIYTVLPPAPGSVVAFPLAINNNGDVVGWGSVNSSSHWRGFVYSGGISTEVLPPGWTDSFAFGINDSGVVVGYGADSAGNIKGFMYSGGAYTELLPPGWIYAEAFNINNSGEVVGWSPAFGEERGFIYDAGAYAELLPPGWYFSMAHAINESGQVVGQGVDNSGTAKGFIYSGGTYTGMLPMGWAEARSLGVNESGAVVGYGVDGTGIEKAFIATPFSSPDTTQPSVSLTCPATVTLNAPASAEVNVTDDLSGIAFQSAPNGSTTLDTSTVGTQTFRVTAWDYAGNSGSNFCYYEVMEVQDTTPPSISLTCPTTVTLNSSAMATVDITDDLSGVASQSAPNGDNLLDSSSVGWRSFTVTATDNAGNSSSNGCDYEVIGVPDSTPPSINLICPITVALNSLATATVDVTDDLSGVAVQSAPNGENTLNTSAVGTWTFTVTAQDNAGNGSSNSCNYDVIADAPVFSQEVQSAQSRVIADPFPSQGAFVHYLMPIKSTVPGCDVCGLNANSGLLIEPSIAEGYLTISFLDMPAITSQSLFTGVLTATGSVGLPTVPVTYILTEQGTMNLVFTVAATFSTGPIPGVTTFTSTEPVTLDLFISLNDPGSGEPLPYERLASLAFPAGAFKGRFSSGPLVVTFDEIGPVTMENIDLAVWGKLVESNPQSGLPPTLDPGRGSVVPVANEDGTIVGIDIKPGSFPNSINLQSNGTIPVVILSSDRFDAAAVDPLTVTLAGAKVRLAGKGKPMASFEDVNGDGRVDLVVHINTKGLQLTAASTFAVLEGRTYPISGGNLIRGADSVRIVP